MAIVELQIREPAFLAFVQADLNRRRLKRPTIPLPAFNGRLLERIECTDCAIVPASGSTAGTILINATLVFLSTTAADARAAGSMQPPATKQEPGLLQLSLSIARNPTAAPPTSALLMVVVLLQIGTTMY